MEQRQRHAAADGNDALLNGADFECAICNDLVVEPKVHGPAAQRSIATLGESGVQHGVISMTSSILWLSGHQLRPLY